MDNLNIHTLLTTVRGFSNDITVRWLADRLGVSTSTVYRCRNAVWPPSIAFEAMRDLLDECCTRFFDGDQKALCDSTLFQLRGLGVDTEPFERVLQSDGYNRFVYELLTCAQNPNYVVPIPEAPSETATQKPINEPNPVSAPSVVPQELNPRHRDFLLAVPIAVILLIGMFNMPLADLFVLAAQNLPVFFGLSFLIAISPALMGTFVDAPIAWHIYRRNNPQKPFSIGAFCRVAKFGDEHDIVPGAGRYDLTLNHFLHQPVCNVFGMLTYYSLFAFLLTLPSFTDFFVSHEWVEFFKAGIAVAFFVAYGHMRDQYSRPCTSLKQSKTIENPDNYLPTRVHVWANTIHLVWSISLLIVLLLSLIAYSIVTFRQFGAPALMVWPYMQGMLYFYYACASRPARNVHATAVGIFLPGVASSAFGVAGLFAICYLPSIGKLAICCVCALSLLGAMAWTRLNSRRENGEWILEQRGTGVYSMAITFAIVILLAIGIVTATIL